MTLYSDAHLLNILGGGEVRVDGFSFILFAVSVEIKRRTINIGQQVNFYLFKVLKMFSPFAHLHAFSKRGLNIFCFVKWSYKKRKFCLI
jgi:hypothetical protein